ncbi:MAG: ATP-binding cassette domain-containing protein, partial [Eubacterium sp.]|nr:ATP-binding cassette domain-containing protein [Eubacterium sp.]
MKTNKPVLKAEELFFTYNGDKHALNGVNLEIYEGERIAVLGSNGAGKSTFFLNINGV